MFLAENHLLEPLMFAEAIGLNAKVRALYKDNQAEATQEILNGEELLGVEHQVLEKSQKLVDCNLYSSGLEIVSLFNATSLLGHVPQDLELLSEELFTLLHGERDLIVPKELPAKEKDAQKLAKEILLQTTKIPLESSVLVLRSRFAAINPEGLRRIRDRLKDFVIISPLGLAYLIYKLCNGDPKKTFIGDETLIVLDKDGSHCGVRGKSTPFVQYFSPKETGGYYDTALIALLIP